MYNLIQVQDAIKTVPLKDVMDYANGKNPQVPSYLALAELNRRKQLQETAESFYGEPGTLKEQIETSLTRAPEGMDPTQTPPGQIDITRTPPQLAPSLAPVQQTAAPQMVNPTAPPMLAARGGLMRSPDIARGVASIPISQFKRRNYAGGGIVAFAGPEGSFVEEDEDYLRREQQRMLAGSRDIVDMLGLALPVSERRPTRNLLQANYSNEGRAYKSDSNAPRVTPSPLNIPQKQESATSSGQIKKPPSVSPPPPETEQKSSIATRMGSPLPTKDEISKAFEYQRELRRLAGVSDDPYAESKRRYERIEQEREARREEEPMKEIMAMLRAYGSAPPEQGWWGGLREASKAGAAMEKEHRELRDKQDMEMAKLYETMAKEEDARRRGDMDKLATASQARREQEARVIALEIQDRQSQAQMTSARANMIQAQRGPQAPAEIQILERMMTDPDFKRQYEERENIKARERARAEAAKNWFSDPGLQNRWKDKGGFEGYIREYESMLGIKGIAPQSGVQVTVGGKTYTFPNQQAADEFKKRAGIR